jgi:hypothetical protein
MPTKKRDALIAELRREVPLHLLIAAVGSVINQRRLRDGLPDGLHIKGEDIDKLLDEFLPRQTIRQLRLLRKIAEELGNSESEPIPLEDLPPEVRARFTSKGSA